MYLKHKLIGASAVLVAFAGIGSATALAQSPSSNTPKAPVSASVKAAEPRSATDTDNIQEGDQNTPDVPGAKETPDPLEAKTSAKSHETSAASGTESTNEAETASASDGPGGHADPPGTVDHQFDGQE